MFQQNMISQAKVSLSTTNNSKKMFLKWKLNQVKTKLI